MPTPDSIIAGGGTAAVILVLLYVAKILWVEHQTSDREVKVQRDEAIAGWKAQSEATEKVAISNDRALAILERLTDARK